MFKFIEDINNKEVKEKYLLFKEIVPYKKDKNIEPVIELNKKTYLNINYPLKIFSSYGLDVVSDYDKSPYFTYSFKPKGYPSNYLCRLYFKKDFLTLEIAEIIDTYKIKYSFNYFYHDLREYLFSQCKFIDYSEKSIDKV